MNEIGMISRKYFKYEMFEQEFLDVEEGGSAFSFEEDWEGVQSLTNTSAFNISSGYINLISNMIVGETYKISFNVNVETSAVLSLISSIGTLTNVYITSPGRYEYEVTATTPKITFFVDDDYYDENYVIFSITNLVIIEQSQEKYTTLDIDQNVKINISKTLKDVRDPGSNGTNWSKTFLLPITPVNSDFFDHYESDDVSASTSLYYYGCYIIFDGINRIKGKLTLDKVITNKDGSKYYSVLFVGEDANLFNSFKENYLYNLDTRTYANLEYSEVLSNQLLLDDGEDAYTKYKAGNTASTMLCYGLFDRGEDLSNSVRTQPLTGATDADYIINNREHGIIPSDLTPGIFNWYLMEKMHEDIGYKVGGDIFEDSNFLNLTTPITRKNFWLDDSESVVDDNTFTDWKPTVDIEYLFPVISSGSPSVTLGETLESDTNTDGRFYNQGGSYSRYKPSDLSLVKQKLDIDGEIYINLGPTPEVTGSQQQHKTFTLTINLYANQEYGLTGDSYKTPVLLWSSDLVTIDGDYTFYVNLITDYISSYYKSDINDMSDLYLEFEVVEAGGSITWSVTTPHGGHGGTIIYELDVTITADFNISTYVDDSDPDNEDIKLRIDRYPNSQIGVFSYPKDITYYDFIKDQINMFNLTVEVDENTKTVNYNRWYPREIEIMDNTLSNGDFIDWSSNVNHVRNGDFVAGSGEWIVVESPSDSIVTFSNEECGIISQTGDTSQISQQLNNLSIGDIVEISFDANGQQGGLVLEIDGNIFQYNKLGVETYTEKIIITSTPVIIKFRNSNENPDCDWIIDNISVSVVNTPDLWSVNNDSLDSYIEHPYSSGYLDECRIVSDGTNALYIQNDTAGLEIDTEYQVTIEIIDSTVGSIYVNVGEWNPQTISTVGVHTLRFNTGNSTTGIKIHRVGQTDITFTGVEVQRVIINDPGTIDLTSNLILDIKSEKKFTNSLTPYKYSYEFSLDDSDYYTGGLETNPTAFNITYPNNKSNSNEIETIIKGNFLYNTDFQPTNSVVQANTAPILSNPLIDTVLEKDSNINYDYSKLYYAYYDKFSTPTNGGFTLHSADLIDSTDFTYIPRYCNNNDSVVLSFKQVEELSYIKTDVSTLYEKYYKNIIELINAPNSYTLTASFMIDSVTFASLNMRNKVRIGNNLFLINKINNWNPNTPTKIELIKLTKAALLV